MSGPATTGGKYDHDRFVEQSFEWPAQADEAVDRMTAASGGESLARPLPRKTPKRAKGNAVTLRLVHCDVDSGVTLEEVRQLGGTVVWSGTDKNGHIYILLTVAVTQEQHAVLCKGLIARFGGDKGKWSDNDLLRPPGTFNYKPTVMNGGGKPAVPVTLAEPFHRL